jgi:hypothetical protein
LARELRLNREERLDQLRTAAAEGAADRTARRASRREQIAAEKAAEAEAEQAAQARRNAHDQLLVERGPLELVLVSGLPRSGTSLMMQMLQAGGMAVVTDGERRPDADNPRGYLEWEAIKKLPQEPAILYQTGGGKVIKAVSMLLPHLPDGHRYKIIFMDRPVEEVATSHSKMIRNRGEKAPDFDPERMRQNLSRHRETVLKKLGKAPGVDLLLVDYPSLVHDPVPWIERIVSFLGPDSIRDPQAMSAAIEPTLYRNRQFPVV